MFVAVLLLALLVSTSGEGYESVDEHIEDALERDQGPVNPVVELPNGAYLHDLDEVFTPEEYNDLFGDDGAVEKSRLTIRAAAIRNKRWPNAVVYYDFDNFGDPKIVLDAMKELEAGTCVKFKRKGSNNKNYVSMVNKSGCWSSLGMTGRGKQRLSLSSRGCRNRDTTLHELLHALGVIHEQERPDRDKHIVINWHNMKPLPRGIPGLKPGSRPNFDRAQRSKIKYYGVPYDFTSVMHYSIWASSKDRKFLQTLVPISNKYGYKYVEKSTEYGLSFGDYKLVNRMYNCAAKCKTKCPEPGYVTKECKCMTKTKFYKQNCKGDEDTGWCLKFTIEGDVDDHLPPDPEGEIEEDKGEKVTTVKPCMDMYSGCPGWAKKGQCEKSHSLYEFTKTRCEKSCKICKI